jgi:hypothetical protein
MKNEKIIMKNENNDVGNKTTGDIELSMTINNDSKVTDVPNQCIRQCSLLLPKCPIDVNSIAIRFFICIYVYLSIYVYMCICISKYIFIYVDI